MKIAFALAEQTKVVYLNLSQNQIDSRAIETIDTLLRYVRTIETFDFTKNDLYQNEEQLN